MVQTTYLEPDCDMCRRFEQASQAGRPIPGWMAHLARHVASLTTSLVEIHAWMENHG